MISTGPFFFRTLTAVFFIVVGLQVRAIPTSAEWLLIDRNANAMVYVEPGTIQRIGNPVRLWVLDDLMMSHTHGAET